MGENAIVLVEPLGHSTGLNKVIRVLEPSLPVKGFPSFPRMHLHSIPAIIYHKQGAAGGKPGLNTNTLKDFRVQQLVVLKDYSPDHQKWSFSSINEHTGHLGIFVKTQILSQYVSQGT